MPVRHRKNQQRVKIAVPSSSSMREGDREDKKKKIRGLVGGSELLFCWVAFMLCCSEKIWLLYELEFGEPMKNSVSFSLVCEREVTFVLCSAQFRGMNARGRKFRKGPWSRGLHEVKVETAPGPWPLAHCWRKIYTPSGPSKTFVSSTSFYGDVNVELWLAVTWTELEREYYL